MKLLKNKNLWVILSIVVLVGVAFTFIPEPIDTDLEKIGNGQKSVVFIYDPNLVASNQQATEISKARDIIGDQANFLLVRFGDPSRESFRSTYQVNPVDLLFFDEDGELFDRDVAVLSAEALIEKVAD